MDHRDTSKIMSPRNRVLGLILLFAGVLVIVAATTTSNDVEVGVIEGLIAIEFFLVGSRLFLTSTISISNSEIKFRTNRYRVRTIPLSELLSVTEGSRELMYKRLYPELHLRSGETVRLTVFEQPVRDGYGHVGTAKRIISELNDSLGFRN